MDVRLVHGGRQFRSCCWKKFLFPFGARSSRIHLDINGLPVYGDADHDFRSLKHGYQSVHVKTGVS